MALCCSCTAPTPLAAPAAVGPDCAWFGDAREGVLYFGISRFWRAMRDGGGDPTAELRAGGARAIGRFDLAHEAALAPLAIGPDDARSGVWDVLAHPSGWVYFTTFWERSGRVNPTSGAVEWFDAAGDGLNELALGPDGRVLATRYGRGGASGSVVMLSERGEVIAEHALLAEAGAVTAAKSLAYDASRNAVWLNTDLLPSAGGAAAHDARVISLEDGRELARWSSPELQFMAFAGDGTGFLVERSEELLLLRVVPAGTRAPPQLAGRIVVLDEAFPALDFAQDVKLGANGASVVTRWSGTVHIASADGAVRTLALPNRDGGLYYTGVARNRELCATRCAGIDVVCARLDDGRATPPRDRARAAAPR